MSESRETSAKKGRLTEHIMNRLQMLYDYRIIVINLVNTFQSLRKFAPGVCRTASFYLRVLGVRVRVRV